MNLKLEASHLTLKFFIIFLSLQANFMIIL
jgi:hypothetical protein